MTAHMCEWCSGPKARPLKRLALAYIRLHPNIPTMTAAQHIGVARQSVVAWRRDAEARGCIPVRTEDGRAGWERRIQARSALPPMTPTWPIGTTWTGPETARAA